MKKPIKIAFLVTDDRFGRDLPLPYFGTAPTALLEGFEMFPEAIEVHVISCMLKPNASPEKLGKNIWFHGLYVPKWGFLRTLHQGCIRAVRKLLKDITPDIVHAQGTERWSAICGIFQPYPKVLTIHGNLRIIDKLTRPTPRLYWKLQTLLEDFCIPRFDGIVCISRHTQRSIPKSIKTWLIPNAVQTSFFQKSQNSMHFDTVVHIGTIGSLKNQIGLLHSLKGFSESLPFRLKFYGPASHSPYVNELQKLVEANASWASYEGSVERKEIRSVLDKSTILILPSFEDNCPMVILEAMASGVAVIGSNVGGIPELIDDGVTGLLCDPHKPETIRNAVRTLLTKPDLRQKLVDAAKEKAVRFYHPKVIANHHLNIYREILS